MSSTQVTDTRYVLFSPLGKTDPINNGYDGAFLHIIRYYHPACAVAFMSKEIVEEHKKDNRFFAAAKALYSNIDLREDMHPDLVDVQKFEIYDKPFREKLIALHAEFPRHQILVNVSSGTPQMKATLYFLAASLPFPIKAIQVSTPERRSNRGRKTSDNPNYNVAEEIANLYDSDPEFAENRCCEVELTNIQRSILLENILGLVSAYDYAGALSLEESAPELFDRHVHLLLTSARQRLALDGSAAIQTFESTDLQGNDVFEVRQGNLIRCYEYILTLNIYLNRLAYSDFARAISPVLTNLLLLTIKMRFGVDVIKELCKKQYNKLVLNSDLIEKFDSDLKNFLTQQFGFSFRETSPAAANLLVILTYLSERPNHERTNCCLDQFKQLREFESVVRNLAAHELIPITADMIHDTTGKKPEDFNLMIRQCFEALCGRRLKWDGYEQMNEMIRHYLKAV